MAEIDRVGENMAWDIEFDKIKDEDNIDVIIADSWFLSDTDLLARVVQFFDVSTPTPSPSPSPLLLPPRQQLSTADKVDKGEIREQGKSRQRKRRYTEITGVNQSGTKRNVRSCINGVNLNNGTESKSKDEGQKGKSGIVASNPKKEGEMSTVKQVLQIPYAERIEMAKRKLQQGYARCKDTRKTTCLISFSDIPKPPCRVLPKTKKVGHHGFLVSPAMLSY